MFGEGGLGLQIGPVTIAPSVLTTWGLMVVLAAVAWVSTRRLRERPGRYQTVLEGLVSAMESTVSGLLPIRGRTILPFVGSLWIFLVAANLLGIVPELSSPTADLSVTVALALLVFLSVHWFGIRTEGLDYLRHYLRPTLIMLPFHLLSEVTRTVALAVRLFGNMMSLETAAVIVLLLAGFLVPVPVLMLHIVEALVQAYIFGMLALVYIVGAMQVHRPGEDRAEGQAKE